MNKTQANAINTLAAWLLGDPLPSGEPCNPDRARDALADLADGAYRELAAGRRGADIVARWPEIEARVGTPPRTVFPRISGTRRVTMRAIAAGHVTRQHDGVCVLVEPGKSSRPVTSDIATLLGYGLARCPHDVGPVELTAAGRAAIGVTS